MTDDPFFIPESSIPKKMVYQWITVAVMGDEKFDQTKYFLKRGWKKVPLARHKKLFPHSVSKKFIEYSGLVLMEQTAKKVNAAKKKDLEKALSMVNAMKTGLGLAPAQPGVSIPIPYPSDAILRPDTEIDYSWERRGNKRYIRWWRRIVCIVLGITERQMARANDGTLVDREGKPIGTKEVAQRVRFFKKQGDLPRRSICDIFKR
jgi:hypothetical protein